VSIVRKINLFDEALQIDVSHCPNLPQSLGAALLVPVQDECSSGALPGDLHPPVDLVDRADQLRAKDRDAGQGVAHCWAVGLQDLAVDVVDEFGLRPGLLGEQAQGFYGAQVEGKVERANADQREYVSHYFGCLCVQVEVELGCEKRANPEGGNGASHQADDGHFGGE